MAMFYTYVLVSLRDRRLYTGCTDDLRKRIQAHQRGKVRSTADRSPLSLIYYEACLHRDDAFRRERFLKTGKGKRFLENRLRSYFDTVRKNESERE
jgi:putative endonuclease